MLDNGHFPLFKNVKGSFLFPNSYFCDSLTRLLHVVCLKLYIKMDQGVVLKQSCCEIVGATKN